MLPQCYCGKQYDSIVIMGSSSVLDEEDAAAGEPMTESKKRSKISKRLKKNCAVKKELIPLKIAILLVYGGKYSIIHFSYSS